MGELDVSNSDSTPCSSPHQSPVSQLPQTTLCPYLLLDVRETDEYDKCHLITGRLIIIMINYYLYFNP